MIRKYLLAPAIWAADETIKRRVESEVIPENGKGAERKVFGGRIIFHRFHNGGAAFSSGKKNKVVTVLAVIFSVIMTTVFFAPVSKESTKLMRCGLAMMLGGAYSNTYDRVHRGYVVDYVSFRNRHSDYMSGIVYNISDFFIAAGALIIVLSSFNEKDRV